MAALTQLILTLLAVVKAIQCVCYSSPLTATTAKKSKYHYPSHYENCAMKIKPASYLSSRKYYLEITWSSSFGVAGDMPSCYNGDYVEVYLTSSYRSIGKFCSNNAGKPFQMYSHDGYAKIIFKSNGYDKSSGFTFYYQLKAYSNEIQFSSPSSTYCPGTSSYSSNNEIYSAGWPNGYAESTSPCVHTVSVSSTYDATKVVFMDVDVSLRQPSSYGCLLWSDHVELKGSNSYSGYKYYISGKLCDNSSFSKTYTTKYKYLQFTFNRKYGGKGNRGFVAGYISYWNKRTSNNHSNGSGGIATSILGKVVGSVVFIIFIIIVGSVIKHKQAQRRRELHTQMIARDAVVPSGTQNTTVISSTQNTGQTAAPYPMASYPAATYPAATYPAATYPTTAYPTDAYPTNYAPSVYPGSDNAPPAYHAVANQPYPMSQPPVSTANQGHYPPYQTKPMNQQHAGPPYQPPGDATMQNAGGQPSAAPYPPPPTVAFGDNTSYPPANIPPGGGPEAYPSMPPPAYSTAANQ